MAIDDNPQLNPKKATVAGESTEEHSLADRVEFERYAKSVQDEAATPAVNKTGLPIFRTRFRHGRP